MQKNIFWQTVGGGYQVSRTYCHVSFLFKKAVENTILLFVKIIGA